MHIPFDNDFSSGTAIDVSGYGNHGLRMSLTNWPVATVGPDGSQAAYFPGEHPSTYMPYGEGQYIAVLPNPQLNHLAQGTILVWAHYNSNSYGASALLDTAAPAITNSWTLSRNYEDTTTFRVATANNGDIEPVRYPDAAPGFDTGGWHYYGVTWDGTNFIGYFDGLPFTTNSQSGIPELVVQDASGIPWICIGCWTHGGTPQWGDPDGLPNNGWFGGEIDDARIYNRALRPSEILALYGSFDKVPPTTPQNLTLRIAASSQAELRWNPATDNRRVEGYRIRRNGAVVGTVSTTCYVDAGLAPQTAYTWTVSAYDAGNNFSSESTPTNGTTPALGGPVDVLVDDADGLPWVSITGAWDVLTSQPGYWGNDFLSDGDTAKGTKSVTFSPLLPQAGDYAVYAWYPNVGGAYYYFPSNVPTDIVHGGATNTVYLDEQISGGAWNYLGTFSFNSGTNGWVRIRTDGTSGYVMADAFRFVK
jgi:hypothetical protein